MKGKGKTDKVREAKIIAYKKDYIRNFFNYRYFVARCNSIADQIKSKKIIEVIDGCPKTEELMTAEYGLMRMQAIESGQKMNEAKRELASRDITEKELEAIERRYYEGNILNPNEEVSSNEGKEAKFVDSSEN